MKIYHGTSAPRIPSILESGIEPRDRRDSNWDINSRNDLVYLTRLYPGYFASAAADEEDLAIVEVDIDLLDQSDLRPDEDFIEQADRQGIFDYGITGADLDERTEDARNKLDEFSSSWPESLEVLGNCAHVGTIPTETITRVVRITPSPQLGMLLLDPTISIQNAMLIGQKYEAITDWMVNVGIGRIDNGPRRDRHRNPTGVNP